MALCVGMTSAGTGGARAVLLRDIPTKVPQGRGRKASRTNPGPHRARDLGFGGSSRGPEAAESAHHKRLCRGCGESSHGAGLQARVLAGVPGPEGTCTAGSRAAARTSGGSPPPVWGSASYGTRPPPQRQLPAPVPAPAAGSASHGTRPPVVRVGSAGVEPSRRLSLRPPSNMDGGRRGTLRPLSGRGGSPGSPTPFPLQREASGPPQGAPATATPLPRMRAVRMPEPRRLRLPGEAQAELFPLHSALSLSLFFKGLTLSLWRFPD